MYGNIACLCHYEVNQEELKYFAVDTGITEENFV
jgi:hypothetical protein